MSFSHVASVGRSDGLVNARKGRSRREERREERERQWGGRQEGGEEEGLRSLVVCEYDYISIDACIVQLEGRGMATGVITSIRARMGRDLTCAICISNNICHFARVYRSGGFNVTLVEAHTYREGGVLK